MKIENDRTFAAVALPAIATPELETETAASVRDKGRFLILGGWLVTMFGIIGYIVALSRAGENADILLALGSQGLLGWGALALIITGVAMWFIGNFTVLHDLAEPPAERRADYE